MNQNFSALFSVQNRLEKRAGKFYLAKNRADPSRSNIFYPLKDTVKVQSDQIIEQDFKACHGFYYPRKQDMARIIRARSELSMHYYLPNFNAV